MFPEVPNWLALVAIGIVIIVIAVMLYVVVDVIFKRFFGSHDKLNDINEEVDEQRSSQTGEGSSLLTADIKTVYPEGGTLTMSTAQAWKDALRTARESRDEYRAITKGHATKLRKYHAAVLNRNTTIRELQAESASLADEVKDLRAQLDEFGSPPVLDEGSSEPSVVRDGAETDNEVPDDPPGPLSDDDAATERDPEETT